MNIHLNELLDILQLIVITRVDQSLNYFGHDTWMILCKRYMDLVCLELVLGEDILQKLGCHLAPHVGNCLVRVSVSLGRNILRKGRSFDCLLGGWDSPC